MQTFEVGKVRIGNVSTGPKKMVPFAYVDGELRFPSLSILLPNATVKSYDVATGRLILTLPHGSVYQAKLRTFQETILHAVLTQQKAWFPGERAKALEDIRAGFQPLIEGDTIHVYCPSTAAGIHDIQVYSKGAWTQGVRASSLQPGSTVRLAIRIQGLSFHQHLGTSTWSGKFRLQHRVLSILVN